MADDLDALIASTPAHKAEHELDALIDATPAAPEGPGVLESLARGGGQGVTLGFGDELAAGAGAYGMMGYDKPPTLSDQVKRYREDRDLGRRENKEAQAAHPLAYTLGNVLGGALSTAVLPGGRAARGASLLARTGTNLLNGAATGGIAGLGSTDADISKGEWKDALMDTAMGGGIGGLLGVALPAVAGGVKKLGGGLLRGFVKPSAEGAALRAMGAKDLTLGQLAPEGLLNHIEQGSEKSLFGHAIKGQREAGLQSWQKVVLPGNGADPAERLASQYADLGNAYDSIGETPIVPAVKGEQGLQPLGDAFDQSASDPSAVATDADVGAAKRFLGNEASAITRQQHVASANMPGPITLRQLQETPIPASMVTKARSNIRGAIRDAKSGAAPDFTLAKLLGNAEQNTTQALEDQLPADQLAKLRETDAAYRQHMTVGDAIRRAGDQGNSFTPSHLSAAVKAAMPNAAYARGAGGQLRELAQLGKETLDAKYPANGSMLMMKIPGVHHVIDGVSAASNLPGPKAFMLGETSKQRALQSLLDNGPSQELIASILRALPSTKATTAGLTEALETP